MNDHLFIAPGDITQLSAHAIAYSANNALDKDGNLYSAFAAHVPGFADSYEKLRQGARPHRVGDTFWLPLETGRLPRGVVAVVSDGDPTGEKDASALAVRAALTAALRELRTACGSEERFLIALPTFRVGKGSEHAQRMGSARAQIAAAKEFLDANDGVDVAFIPYTTPLYQIFLEARRELLGDPGGDTPRYSDLEQALIDRECVLFVGAGLSSGAGLPDWDVFVRRLIDDLGIEWHDRLDYLDLTQWYRERFGPDKLAEVIRQTCTTDAHPTLAHYLLLSLPLRHVITTNYDDLLERTLSALKRHPVKVVHQEDVARTGRDDVFVVKLHGDSRHADEIIVSRDDYDEFFERRPAMALLLEGLLLNQTFFFVGYGLRDPNFRQIHSRIARTLREARRPAFATTFEASGDSGAYLIEQWGNKQLRLIGIPGQTKAEQQHALLRFLDELSAQVALRMPRLFLAPDVRTSEALMPLRRLFVEEVGAAMASLAERELSGPDVRYLAEVLEFLTAHGWRPDSRTELDLCRLWEHLAEHAEGAGEKHRLLIFALRTAEAFADGERIRGRIKELEGR